MRAITNLQCKRRLIEDKASGTRNAATIARRELSLSLASVEARWRQCHALARANRESRAGLCLVSKGTPWLEVYLRELLAYYRKGARSCAKRGTSTAVGVRLDY